MLVEERIASARNVATLFEFLMEQPRYVPEWADESAPLHRRVCDYIAGMTDGYFRRVYAELLGSAPLTR